MEIFNLAEGVFRAKNAKEFEMPGKQGIHTANDGSLHAMPAWLPSLGALGCKWVSSFERNPDKGLPSLSGILILNSPETGRPTTIMDCGWVTEQRTGASTAVSAKYLARDASSSVAIIGCGAEGWSNLTALVKARPALTSAIAFDTHAGRLRDFVQLGRRELGVEVTEAEGPEAAIRSGDIIVTATTIAKQPKGIIRKDWIQEGSFVTSLDYDTYWSPEALFAVDKLFTDDVCQLRRCQEEGYMTRIPQIRGEIGDLVAGKMAGREREEEIILALNLGIGLLDVALGVKMSQLALDAGCGTWLST
jgi:ornithine cyclodeaminase/alanine dehydrogenase